MTRDELYAAVKRYAHLDREWCILYDEEYDNENDGAKIEKRMREIQIEAEDIVDELCSKLGLKE